MNSRPPVDPVESDVVRSDPAVAPQPFALVIFGASGDLARRKLVPALWRLSARGGLPDRFAVIGYARTATSDDAFRAEMKAACLDAPGAEPAGASQWNAFARRLSYVSGRYENPDDYGRLDEALRGAETAAGTTLNRIFYLATPAGAYADIIAGAGGLPRGPGDRRIVVEKPFGRNLDEARRLNDLTARHFDERQTFRIDHYLGKETVQNILILRYTNAIFEPLWNRQHVAWVRITAAETLGVESRGGYYEQAGALRDMVQMHLLQLLALVAMEQPASFAAADVRDEKAKLLRAVRPTPGDLVRHETVRGQYGPGRVGGRDVPGYRQERGVAGDSTVETFAALRLWIDNWRWQGVPFILQTGKRLDRSATEIAIGFQCVPTCLFSNRAMCARIEPNVLVLRIHPREGVHLALSSKVPGEGAAIGPVTLDFAYADVFGVRPPEAYETLLVDVMRGDAALFARRDQVELSWRIVDPVLGAWQAEPPGDFPNYAAGTPGPAAADSLTAGMHHYRHDAP